MDEMTLLYRHRIRNSIPGRLSPRMVAPGHRGPTRNTSERGKKFFYWNLDARVGFEPVISDFPSRQLKPLHQGIGFGSYFAKQDAWSPRAYFTILESYQNEIDSNSKNCSKYSSSFIYFHYCFIQCPRPYTHVGHWEIFVPRFHFEYFFQPFYQYGRLKKTICQVWKSVIFVECY